MRPQVGLCPVVVLCRRPADRLAVQHDLRLSVALRLQQDRVHVGGDFYTGGGGLHRLRPSQFPASGRHPGVVRHVLGLERRHRTAVLVKDAAKRRCEHALANRRRRTLDHQGRGRRAIIPIVHYRAASFSTERFEVCCLIERLESDQVWNDVNDGEARVAQTELGHCLWR